MNRRTFLGTLAAGFGALLGLRGSKPQPAQWETLNDARPRLDHVNVASYCGQFRAIAQPGERILPGQLLVSNNDGTLRPYRPSDGYGSGCFAFIACEEVPESPETRKVLIGRSSGFDRRV